MKAPKWKYENAKLKRTTGKRENHFEVWHREWKKMLYGVGYLCASMGVCVWEFVCLCVCGCVFVCLWEKEEKKSDKLICAARDEVVVKAA